MNYLAFYTQEKDPTPSVFDSFSSSFSCTSPRRPPSIFVSLILMQNAAARHIASKVEQLSCWLILHSLQRLSSGYHCYCRRRRRRRRRCRCCRFTSGDGLQHFPSLNLSPPFLKPPPPRPLSSLSLPPSHPRRRQWPGTDSVATVPPPPPPTRQRRRFHKIFFSQNYCSPMSHHGTVHRTHSSECHSVDKYALTNQDLATGILWSDPVGISKLGASVQ